MNYYNEIKEQLINNEITKKVKDYSKNKSDLETYYNVGKLLIEAQGGEERAKYGDNLIKEYSKKLTLELGKKYNTTLLKRIRQFYLLIEKGAPLGHQLSWSHYRELLPLKDLDMINYYIDISIKCNLSRDELKNRIKSKEYERLPIETRNKLVKKEEVQLEDYIKNPIIIKNSNNDEIINEKALKKLILENIDNFLKELGIGYTYVGNEYKIKLGSNNNYIDLLLFNIELNCYIVIELKITELKKEHIGQIKLYMNYIDKNIKKITHDKTIGIIISKRNNEYVIEYCSDKRVLFKEFALN